MKRFIKITLFGIVVFSIFWLFIEYYQSKVLNSYSYKYKYMEQKSDKIKILILGNSYMENSFNPHILGEGVFDLAISARWIYYDYILLDKYISQMRNLKCVIFGMGYAQPFNGSYNFPEEDSESANYQKYMYQKFMNISFYNKWSYWLGLFRGYINVSSLKGEKGDRIVDSVGYLCSKGQQEGWRSKHNIEPDIIYNPHAQEQISEYTLFLKEMSKLCYLNNVRFIVITPPCHNSYNINVKQDGLNILYNMINEVKSEYPLEYRNYLKDEEFRADSLYYNCSHLNTIGADLFALRVKRDFCL